MKILAIDTSGDACGACVYDADAGRTLAIFNEIIGRGHAERLMDIISKVMKEACVEHSGLDRVAVCTGPGSFTGIRVGVATARGFGLGLGIPVIGVSELDALMEDLRMTAGDAATGVVLHTGRDEVYALFSFDTQFADAGVPFVCALNDLASGIGHPAEGLFLAGTAASELADRMGGIATVSSQPDTASLETIARIAATRTATAERPEPLYLRKPDAKPQGGFAVQRA
jgi:tRNA threonylcarbamoyl adenosine modification protein YeaZ